MLRSAYPIPSYFYCARVFVSSLATYTHESVLVYYFYFSAFSMNTFGVTAVVTVVVVVVLEAVLPTIGTQPLLLALLFIFLSCILADLSIFSAWSIAFSPAFGIRLNYYIDVKVKKKWMKNRNKNIQCVQYYLRIMPPWMHMTDFFF